jgi:Cft2 family RNA processing exonuclease
VDSDGIAFYRLLERVACGEIVETRKLLKALQHLTLTCLPHKTAPRVFHLLYGSLELLTYEEYRADRFSAAASAADVFGVVAGLARGIGERGGERLDANVTHFLVHAAAFLEANTETDWPHYSQRVGERLANWSENPAADVVLRHAAYNLYLTIPGGPNDDSSYKIVQASIKALRDGEKREDVHSRLIAGLGWRTADSILTVLLPSERRSFYDAACRAVDLAPPIDRVDVARRVGLVDALGEPALPGTRLFSAPVLTFPGGTAIGRSCMIYEGAGVRLAFDMGGDQYGRVPAWSPTLQDLDALFVSHAHHDHIGGLFYLYGELGFSGGWYAHPVTIACAELALRDSLALRSNDEREGTDLLDPAILDRIISHARPLPAGQSVSIGGVRVHSLDAGHVRGSLQFVVEATAEGRPHRTLVSGDINPANSLSVPPLQYPSGLSIDCLVVEGTNVFRDESIVDGSTGAAALRALISAQASWPVLLPVMGLGRAQEIIAALSETPWRVGVFGLAAKMTRASGLPVPSNVVLDLRSAREVRRRDYDVLVATAGCLQGGPSRYFWAESGWMPATILTGYLFPGTPAHAHEKEFHQVRFSGHASFEGWREYVAHFPEAKRFLVHYPGSRARAEEAGFTVPRIGRVYEA